MTNLELARALKHNMFATRSSVDEALEYAYSIARASDNPAAVMTAVQVVVNTLCDQIIQNAAAEETL
jgi:hypothetical protein